MKNKGFLGIVVVCVVMFVAQLVDLRVTTYLILNPTVPIWWILPTLITHMFLHGGIRHIFFNLFFVAPFALFYENLVGIRTFLKHWLICGILAAVFQMSMPSLFGQGAMLGASGACAGIMTLGMLKFAENRHITLKILSITGIVGFFMLNLLPGIADCFIPSGVAHMAHVGGMLTGMMIYSLRGSSEVIHSK
jgi:membrane associated rhomboid family serine protease